jgi:hypothetical protein
VRDLQSGSTAAEEDAAMQGAWKQRADASQADLGRFWAADVRRQNLLEALVTVHAPLSVAELSEWHEDPETFFHAEAGARLDDEKRGGFDILLRVRAFAHSDQRAATAHPCTDLAACLCRVVPVWRIRTMAGRGLPTVVLPF